MLRRQADHRRLQRRRRRLPRRRHRAAAAHGRRWRSSSASASRCASVIVPARRAAKIPPVAAMRPELGFEALQHASGSSSARSSPSSARVMFLVGLFVRPGGTPGLIVLAGGGALLIFLGVASVSSTVARPVTKLIGWPVAKVYKTPGELARENAGRAPRRTSATRRGADDRRGAGQRGGGVRVVAARHVRRASSSAAVTADYIVTDESFQGLPPTSPRRWPSVPELSAVTRRARRAGARSTATQKAFGAVDPVAFEQLVDLDLDRRQLRGPRRRRHLRPQGPGQGPRPGGRRHRRR